MAIVMILRCGPTSRRRSPGYPYISRQARSDSPCCSRKSGRTSFLPAPEDLWLSSKDVSSRVYRWKDKSGRLLTTCCFLLMGLQTIYHFRKCVQVVNFWFTICYYTLRLYICQARERKSCQTMKELFIIIQIITICNCMNEHIVIKSKSYSTNPHKQKPL